MKQETTQEQKEGDHIMLKDSIACKVMASTGGNSESTIPQGRQKQLHAEIKSTFSRKSAGEQHKHASQRREDLECEDNPYSGERDMNSNRQELETNSRFTSAANIKRLFLNIWRVLLNGDAFGDAYIERKYIQEHLENTAESCTSIQICFACAFLVLSAINMSEQHFGESSTDDSLGQSIVQVLIAVIDILVLVVSSRVKYGLMWRVCIVTWQLAQSVYLEEILFGDLNSILYQNLGDEKCWNEGGGSNTFELKYQLLKGISVVFNSFFLLRNLQAWNYRLILSVLLIAIYSVVLFHRCSFWIYIITLFFLTLLFLFYQFQAELRQRNCFKQKLLESPEMPKGSNSPSLYNMVHEQISSGIIVVSRSSFLQSDLSLKFANKISIKQLNCHNENEILTRFKEIFIPIPGMSSSPNPQSKQTNSLYDMLMNYLDQIARNSKKSSVSNNIHKDGSNSSPKKNVFSSANSFKPQMVDNTMKRKLLTIKKTNSLVQISKPDSSVRIRLNSLGMQSQRNGRRSSQPQNNPFYGIGSNVSKPNTISDNSSLLHQPVLNLSAIQEHHSFKPSNDSIMTPSSSKLKVGLQQKSTSSEKHKDRNSFTDGKMIYGVLKSVQKSSQKESQPDLCDPIAQEKESQESEEDKSDELNEEDELNSPSMVQVQLTDSEKLFRQFDFKINQIEWDNQPALIILVTDSTQKLINEKLKELEMYKEELLYTMQHISRTPLNSIINISEILLSQYFKQYNKSSSHLTNQQKEIDQLEDIVQSLHIIKNNGYILLHTINTVTDLSAFQTNQGKLDIDSQPFSLKEVLDEIQDLYLHQIQEKKLTFSVTISTPSDNMNSDKKRITQLLFEIIGNAIKYTQSGFVHVKIKEQEKGLFWVKVQDSGEGMSEEHKRNLFCNSVIQYCQRERDFSKKTSTGLGLDFSRKIVGILGPFYQIFVKSTQRQGSTFKFLLFQDFDTRKTIDILSLRARIIMLQNQPPDQEGGIFTPDQIEKMATDNNNSKHSHKIYNQQNNNSSSTQIQISSYNVGAKPEQQYFKKLNASPKIQFSNTVGASNYPQYPCENQGDDTIEVGAESISNFHLASNNNNNNRNSINSGKAALQFQSQQISLILGKKDNNLFQSEIKEEKSNISLLKHSPNLQLQKYTSLDYDNNQRYIFPQSANYNNNRRSQFEIDLGHSTILNQSIQKPLKPRKKSKQFQNNFGQLSNISSHIFSHISPSDNKIPFIEITEEIRAKYHTGTQEIKQAQCVVDESQRRSQISSPSNIVNDSVGSKYSPIQLTQHEMICKPRNDLNLLTDTPYGIAGNSIENMLQKHENYELSSNSYSKSPYLSACCSNKPKINEMPFSQHKWRYPMHPRAELNKLQNRNDLTDDEADNQLSLGDTPMQSRINSELQKDKKVLPVSPYKREIENKRNQQKNTTQICQTLKIDDFEGKLWQIFSGKCYILGIDDNVFNLNILEMVFKKCSNVIFHKACNGQECLDKALLLKQQQNQSYKIFLIDIQMPIMDGYKAHEELKLLMKKKAIDQAPVFAVTAYANEKAICLQQGMEGFIEKPINMKILVSLIYDYFFNREELQMQQRHYLNQYLQNHQQ